MRRMLNWILRKIRRKDPKYKEIKESGRRMRKPQKREYTEGESHMLGQLAQSSPELIAKNNEGVQAMTQEQINQIFR